MRTLCTLLGLPQHRFASIHVVGTNGKSSVARMIAALLEAHGIASGAFLSPHAERWSEGVLVRGEEIGVAEFSIAVERAAEAAVAVERKPHGGGPVTAFELATAAAFVAFARARVGVAVVEAGLGGEGDATNTIPSRSTVLTSIGLDHTQWLGESEEEIAAAELAVLRDNSTLVLGRVSPTVAALAERTARERGARLVVAPEDPGPGVSLRALGPFQRRNFALACAAAEAFRGALDQELVAAVASCLEVPGRLEEISGDPPVLLDAAHNPDGAAALAAALPEVTGGRPVVACLAVLADKDAAAIVRALTPSVSRAVCTEPPTFSPADGTKSGPRVRFSSRRRVVGAQELAGMSEATGIPATAEPDFAAAVSLARELARERDGIVLVTGSHRVLAPARTVLARQGLCED